MLIFPTTKKVIAQNHLYYYVSAEEASILQDWRLEENDTRYSVAISGDGMKPSITEDSYSGTKALLYECPEGSVTQRIEHKLLNTGDPLGLHFDNERYIGFSLKIPDGFTTPINSVIFCQAWQGDPYGPVAMLKFMQGNSDPFRIKCTIRNTATGQQSTDPDSSLWQGYIQRNKWYRFVWHIKPRLEGDSGIVRLWINDSLKFTWNGNIGYLPASKGGLTGTYNDLVVKYGIYQPGANTAHKLLFDEIKAADNFDMAQPFTNIIPSKTICPGANSTSLSCGYINAQNQYQWQIDDGSGFKNISNTDIFKNTDSSSIQLLNVPSEYYGYHLRCKSNQQTGIVYQLKFESSWNGTEDNNWHNNNNWECNKLPDSNTDVIIMPSDHNPNVKANAACRSIIVREGTSVNVESNVQFDIIGK